MFAHSPSRKENQAYGGDEENPDENKRVDGLPRPSRPWVRRQKREQRKRGKRNNVPWDAGNDRPPKKRGEGSRCPVQGCGHTHSDNYRGQQAHGKSRSEERR